jgi:hypothetical protein
VQAIVNGLIIVGVLIAAVLASISLTYAINVAYVSDRRNGELKRFCLLGYEGTVDTGDGKCVMQYTLQSLVILPLVAIFIGIPYAQYRCTTYPDLVDRYRRITYYICIFGTITSWANYGYLEYQVGRLCTWINESLNLVCLGSVIRTSEDIRPLESVDAMRKFHLGPPIYFMMYPILFVIGHNLERRLASLLKNL